MTARVHLAAIGATALLLGGCATPYMKARAAEKSQVQAVESSLEGARYVAIGSSYAAGPQLPPGKPGAPVRCGQSLNNYPTLLAERFGMLLVDRTCSGATTDHVLGPWGEIPPQIAAVTADTRLVTVTIGGNDLSYIGNLFSASCAFNARKAGAAPADARPKSGACGLIRVPTEADYRRDEAQMTEIARRIHAAAPRAKLVFVQYLTPIPAAGQLCAVTPVTEADAAIVREIGRRLAEITGRVALSNGATVVEMNQLSASHTPCDPVPWMIGFPANYDGRQGLQWHLNKAGMAATAEGIAYWLTKEGVRPVKPSVTIESGAEKPAEKPAPTMPAPGAPLPADPVPKATGTPVPPATPRTR